VTKRLIILLHGVGSHGDDLMHLGDIWREILRGVALAMPDAPFPFEGGAGRQWFSVAGVTAANRGERVAAARPTFDRLLRGELARHGLVDAPERVALAGFSQGGIMALDALASGRWPVAGVVAFSARLATPEPLSPPAGSAALLIHGEDDRIIRAGESTAAAERLRRAGVETGLFVEPGLGNSTTKRLPPPSRLSQRTEPR
jgi:phospholipase/carboxylesterase